MSTFYESITGGLQGLYERAWESHGMLVLDLLPANLTTVVARLKDDYGCALFLDVTAIDYPERKPRFEVVYHFLCPAQMQRIRLKLGVDEQSAELPTLTGSYGAARYMEREVHDMYDTPFYNWFRRTVSACVRRRWLTIAVTLLLRGTCCQRVLTSTHRKPSPRGRGSHKKRRSPL